MKTLKSLLALSAVALFPSVSSAAGYDVNRYWASGDNYIVSYVNEPEAHTESFTIVHDEVAQMVTFEFSWGQYGSTGSCSVGIDSTDEGRPVGHVYQQAAELAANIDTVQQFRVASWAGVCYELAAVEYRTDVALVEFSCDSGYTYWGQNVYVVGNTPSLGNWNPAKAVKLDADNYPLWKKSLLVESEEHIEWKCIKRDAQDPTAGLVWQSGDNNLFHSGLFDDTAGSF